MILIFVESAEEPRLRLRPPVGESFHTGAGCSSRSFACLNSCSDWFWRRSSAACEPHNIPTVICDYPRQKARGSRRNGAVTGRRGNARSPHLTSHRVTCRPVTVQIDPRRRPSDSASSSVIWDEGSDPGNDLTPRRGDNSEVAQRITSFWYR